MPKGKRKNSRKNSVKNKEKQYSNNKNLNVMVLIVLAILLGVLIYTKEGYLGETLSPILGGIFGCVKYIIPIGILLLAFYIAHQKNEYYSYNKVIMLMVIFMFIDCILTCYQVSIDNLKTSLNFDEFVSKSFDLGRLNIGGGAVGAIIAYPFSNLMGLVGTVILSIGVDLILLVLIFGLKPADAISNSMDKMQERKEEKKEERKKIKEQYDENKMLEESQRDKRKNEKKKMDFADDQITINLSDNNQKKQSEESIDVPNFNGLKFSKLHKGKDYNNFKNIENDENNKPINENNQQNANEDNSLFAQKEISKEAKTEQVLQLSHTMTEAELNYEFPPIELLNLPKNKEEGSSKKALLATAEKLKKTLHSFGVSAKVENVSVGPAITRYELTPAEGVRVSKISNLADDIALSLEAETIRIEAPIPGKHTVGIEVPNKVKSIVSLREIIESDEFQNAKSKTTFALGRDVAGNTIITDIAKMPHLLIAGSTGSGKSVCINTLIASIIYKAKPNEVKLLMIDPKIVELSIYNGIPHLLIPVVTDAKKAAGALNWAVQEMENRYLLFASKNVRNIEGYNELAETNGEQKLPHMVIIIDELADLMMVAAKEVEDAICRLAQKARAAGMHLVIATQRPSVDVITGIIKANIPSRIAFAVSSQVDSRTILDGAGAEKLLGKGDMLFFPTGFPKPVRVQGAFISDKEVENIVKFIKKDGDLIYDTKIMETIERQNEPEKVKNDSDEEDDGTDPLLEEAINLVVENQTASTSFIQRKLKVRLCKSW